MDIKKIDFLFFIIIYLITTTDNGETIKQYYRV